MARNGAALLSLLFKGWRSGAAAEDEWRWCLFGAVWRWWCVYARVGRRVGRLDEEVLGPVRLYGEVLSSFQCRLIGTWNEFYGDGRPGKNCNSLRGPAGNWLSQPCQFGPGAKFNRGSAGNWLIWAGTRPRGGYQVIGLETCEAGTIRANVDL